MHPYSRAIHVPGEEEYWLDDIEQPDFYDEERWIPSTIRPAGEGPTWVSTIHQPGYYDANGMWIPAKLRRAVQQPGQDGVWLKKVNRPEYYVDERWMPTNVRRTSQHSSDDAVWVDQPREGWGAPKLYRIIDQGRGDAVWLNRMEHPAYYSATDDRWMAPKVRWAIRPSGSDAGWIDRPGEAKYYNTEENWIPSNVYRTIQSPGGNGVRIDRMIPAAIGKPLQRRINRRGRLTG